MKNLESFIGYSCYKYAPESFNLLFRGKKVELPMERRSYFGNILLSKGEEKLLEELKRYVRKQSSLSRTIRSMYLVILYADLKSYITIRYPVNQHDIEEKLYIFKEIKEQLRKGHYPIKTTSAKLDHNMKLYDVQEYESKVVLSKRVKLIVRNVG